jgi:hypothetical protein
MSIDAVISAVEYPGDGTAILRLKDRIRGSGERGQDAFTVTNPPPGALLDAVIGMEVWGNSTDIMIGDRRWARRLGYCRIELLPKPPEKKP